MRVDCVHERGHQTRRASDDGIHDPLQAATVLERRLRNLKLGQNPVDFGQGGGRVAQDHRAVLRVKRHKGGEKRAVSGVRHKELLFLPQLNGPHAAQLSEIEAGHHLLQVLAAGVGRQGIDRHIERKQR